MQPAFIFDIKADPAWLSRFKPAIQRHWKLYCDCRFAGLASGCDICGWLLRPQKWSSVAFKSACSKHQIGDSKRYIRVHGPKNRDHIGYRGPDGLYCDFRPTLRSDGKRRKCVRQLANRHTVDAFGIRTPVQIPKPNRVFAIGRRIKPHHRVPAVIVIHGALIRCKWLTRCIRNFKKSFQPAFIDVRKDTQPLDFNQHHLTFAEAYFKAIPVRTLAQAAIKANRQWLECHLVRCVIWLNFVDFRDLADADNPHIGCIPLIREAHFTPPGSSIRSNGEHRLP